MKLLEAITRLEQLHDTYGNVELKLYETLVDPGDSQNLMFDMIDNEVYVRKNDIDFDDPLDKLENLYQDLNLKPIDK